MSTSGEEAKKPMSVRLPPPLLEELNRRATRLGLKPGTYAAQLLERVLTETTPAAPPRSDISSLRRELRRLRRDLANPADAAAADALRKLEGLPKLLIELAERQEDIFKVQYQQLQSQGKQADKIYRRQDLLRRGLAAGVEVLALLIHDESPVDPQKVRQWVTENILKED